MAKETAEEKETPKDEHDRPINHWSQGDDKANDLVDTDRGDN